MSKKGISRDRARYEALADTIPERLTHKELAHMMYPGAKDPGHQLRIRAGMRDVHPNYHVRVGSVVQACYLRETALLILEPKVRKKRGDNG